MASEDMIRQLLGKGGKMISAPAGQMGEAMRMLEESSQYAARCRTRNLRGECAHPHLSGEYGLMSWDEYDALRSGGKDPEAVSYEHANRPRPYEDSRMARMRSRMGEQRS